jgi:hypothetical protein
MRVGIVRHSVSPASSPNGPKATRMGRQSVLWEQPSMVHDLPRCRDRSILSNNRPSPVARYPIYGPRWRNVCVRGKTPSSDRERAVEPACTSIPHHQLRKSKADTAHRPTYGTGMGRTGSARNAYVSGQTHHGCHAFDVGPRRISQAASERQGWACVRLRSRSGGALSKRGATK